MLRVFQLTILVLVYHNIFFSKVITRFILESKKSEYKSKSLDYNFELVVHLSGCKKYCDDVFFFMARKVYQ